MELKRLEKAVADRWVLVAGMAIIGVVAAFVFGGFARSSQSNIFQATAAIRFAPPEGGTIADLTEEIAEAQNLANIAAAELLESNPNSLIVEDLPNARLTFVAQGSTRDEASSKAQDLLQAFLDVDPLAGGSVDALLEDVLEQAREVQTEIDELTAEPTPEEQELANEHARIDQSIVAINEALANLIVQEAAAADSATRADIADQRDFLNSQLEQLQAERAELPALPSEELAVDDSLRLAALQAQMDELTADYQRLTLRQVGVTADGSAVAEPIVRDLTPEPIHPVVNSAIGLLGGVLIAILAIIFINRTRRPVWIAEDISMPLLGSVPARRVTTETMANWYNKAEAGPRKSAVQALRSAIEAQVPSTGATIALTGLEVPPEAVQALASDLSSSLASAGTSVLLVDANFESRTSIGQYVAGGPSVAGVLGLDATVPEFEAQVRHTLESAHRVSSGMTVLPSGPPPTSPADQLAGRQFRKLMAVGQETYDIVVVVVDEIDTPGAQVAMQRLGYGIMVMTPGVSTIPEIKGIASDIERLRVAVLGAVFLEKLRKFLPAPSLKRDSDAGEESTQSTHDEGIRSPISRLDKYPGPEGAAAGAGSHGSLDNFAETMGAEQEDEQSTFGEQLVAAIKGADPTIASESVASYLMTQTEDMVLARHESAELSSELVGVMSDYGFLSLRHLADFKTPAAWLDHEIAHETSESMAVELIEAMERALGAGEDAVRIDDWLDEEFFSRHLERSDGQPAIWHLVSPERTVSVLVPARRLSVMHLELIRAEVVDRTLDELERFRSAAVSRSDLELAAVYEGKIKDTHWFARALTALIGETQQSSGGRGGPVWQPDWSKGTRANLASLQASGLLPFEVLDDDEVSDLLASA